MKCIAFQEKVKQLHPGWEYIFWTDEANSKFTQKYFPEFYSTYLSLPKNIMRVDMIRYLIIYKMGGIYFDLDYEMIKPFDLLQYDLVLPYSRSKLFGDSYDSFGNSVFASAPGHIFWKYVLDSLKDVSNHNEYKKLFRDLSSKDYITKRTTIEEAITGPGLITRILNESKFNRDSCFLPLREKFHPPIPRNKIEYLALINKGESYGIHHCFGSWRYTSIIGKIKLKLKNTGL